MSIPTALSITAPSAMPGPLDILSTPTPSSLVLAAGEEVMWVTIAQPLLQHMYPDPLTRKLEEQVELLQLELQECDGGNVTVTEDPLFFPPSLSLDDFISYAFHDTTSP